MNLNNELRKNLFEAVILDQFEGDLKSAQQKINDAIESEIKKLDKGDSRKIIDFANSLENDFIQINTQSFCEVGGRTIKYDDKYRVINPFCKKFPVIFKFKDKITVKTTVLRRYDLHIDRTDKIQSALDEAKHLVSKITEIGDSLSLALSSVRTISKLQEQTNVFDPFIPAPKQKNNQMIPAEHLCKINELKTPKKQKKPLGSGTKQSKETL